ncbi:hypothetical protein ACFLTH_12135 [Bacteroidota bacterium]
MGQQQLLLILLGVIVVSIAVATGVNIFVQSYDQEILDMMLQRMNELSVQANQYRMKPRATGGGGGSFTGFQIYENNALNYAFASETIGYQDYAKIYLISKSTTSAEGSHAGGRFYCYGLVDIYGIKSVYLWDPQEGVWDTITGGE